MNSIHATSSVSAITAGIFASLFAWFFHYNSFPIGIYVGLLFGVLASLVAYLLVYNICNGRYKNKKPVLGVMRGATIGIIVFLITIIVHSVFFPGRGGFFASIVPITLIGLALFGWFIAIVGAVVGFFCERFYFK